MVAIVAGGGLGLFNTSLNSLGGVGQPGSGKLGGTTGTGYVNAATGNLILQSLDEQLSGRGADLFHLRSYNAQGQLNDGDADGWRWEGERQVVLTGTVNTLGSTVTRTGADGHTTVFAWNGSAYVSPEGAGAHDTITWDSGASQWVYTEGSSRTVERYDGTSGRLASVTDATGNSLTYSYNGSGQLSSVLDSATNQELVLVYDGNGRLERLDTKTQGGSAVRQVYYSYDSSGRLTSVTTDLTPADNSISDGATYVTSYTYDGSSFRIASISQSDGTSASFTYVQVGSDYRIETVTDASGTTTFSYDTTNRETTVTTATGQAWKYVYDTANRLTEVRTPAVNGQVLVTSYGYDSDGNVTSVTDGRGNVVTYQYDANGNQILERDALGNTVERTYNSNNQLQNLIQYTSPATWNSGTSTWTNPSASTAQVTRYAYDSSNRLRFSVSAEGRVTEYRYNSAGLRSAEIHFSGASYDLSALAITDTLSESTLATWSGNQSAAATTLTSYEYDARGDLSKTIVYAATSAVGTGTVTHEATITEFVYSAHGQLLQTIAVRGSARDQLTTLSSRVYDGLGRLTSEVGSSGTTSYVYGVNGSGQGTVAVTGQSGLTTTQTFDARGRLISVLQAATGETSRAVTYVYDTAGRLRMTEDAVGARSYLFYDTAERIAARVDATGAVTEYVYNATGQVTSEIRYATRVDTSTWFSSGAVTVSSVTAIRPATQADDRTVSSTYDNANRLATTTDAAGTVSTYSYDGADRLVQVTVGSGSSARNSRSFYGNDGQLLATLDGEGYLVEHVYNAAGQKIKTIRYATATATSSPTNSTLRSTGSLTDLRPATSAMEDLVSYSFYDQAGRLIGNVDEQQFVTAFGYDEAGNQQSVTRYGAAYTTAITGSTAFSTIQSAVSSGTSQTTTTTFDSFGRVATRTNAEGTVTAYEYDAAGRLVKETTAQGTSESRTTRTQHNAFGDVKRRLSAEQVALVEGAGMGNLTMDELATVFASYGLHFAFEGTYDAAGRRVRVTDQAGNVGLFYYDANGRLLYSLKDGVDGKGEVAETQYNTFGEVKQSSTFAERLEATDYQPLRSNGGGTLLDPQSNPIKTLVEAIRTANKDHKTALTYNSRGLVATSTDANGVVTTYQYNDFGQLQSETRTIASGNTVTTTYAYNKRGELTGSALDPTGLNLTRSTGYDAFGRIVSQTDAAGKTTTSVYENYGRTIAATDPLTHTRRTSYDAFGRVLSVTDALNQTTSYAYNDSTRTVTVTTPEGIVTSTTRTRHGEVLTVTDGNGHQTHFDYNQNGELLTVTNDQDVVTTTNVYNIATGRLDKTLDARGGEIRYTYDPANRVLTRLNWKTGGQTTYAYDGQGRVTETTETGALNAKVTRYDYDAKGQVLTVTTDPEGLQLVTTYEYDGVGQQVTVKRGTTLSPAQQVTTYEYDKAGRRTKEIIDPTGLAITTRYKYDSSGRLTRQIDALNNSSWYLYNDAGLMTHSVDALGGVTEYGYDAENRVTVTTRYATPVSTTGFGDSVASVSPSASAAQDQVTRTVYDHDGRARFTLNALKEVSERVYDDAGNVIATLRYSNPLGSLPGTLDVPGLQSALAGNPAITTQHVYNELNQQRFEIDALGYVTEWEYDVAGSVTAKKRYQSVLQNLPSPLTADNLEDALTDPVTGLASTATHYVYDQAGRLVYTVDALNYVTEHAYDNASQLTVTRRYRDALPANTALTLEDIADLTTEVNAPNLGTTLYLYDAAGRVISTEQLANDSLGGQRVERTYDALGNVTRERMLGYDVPTNTTQETNTYRFYDALGREIYSIDALLNVTERQYDSTGQVIAEVRYGEALDALPASLTELQDELDDITDKVTTRYVRDQLGRVRFTIDALRHVSESRYNSLGQLVDTRRYAIELPSNTPLTVDDIGAVVGSPVTMTGYEYDAIGRLTATHHPSGLVTERSYTSMDGFDVVQVRDFADSSVAGGPLETITFRLYDALGRERYVIDPLLGVTERQYDAAGEVIAEIRFGEPLSSLPATITAFETQLSGISDKAVTRFVYDDLGRQRFTIDALQQVNERVYDGSGRVIQEIRYAEAIDNLPATLTAAWVENELVNPEQILARVYDALGRERFTIDAGNQVSENVYDELGHLIATRKYLNPIPSNTALTESDVEDAIETANTVNPPATPVPTGPVVGIASGSSEFHVNTYITSDQQRPSVTALASGGSVAVWQSSGQDGSGAGIYGQIFDANGNRSGNEFLINDITAGDQSFLSGGLSQGGSVAALPDGRFLVTWLSGGKIYFQDFYPNGTPKGAEGIYQPPMGVVISNPSIAVLPNEQIVIAWQAVPPGGVKKDIYLAHYKKDGKDDGDFIDSVGGIIRVNSDSGNLDDQQRPVVTALPNGTYVVTYVSEVGGTCLKGQLFDAGASKLGAEFQVNTAQGGALDYVTNTALADGGFVSVWRVLKADGSVEIRGQRFDALAAKVGAEFTVNATLQAGNELPTVAPLLNGGFVVGYTAINQDGSGSSVVTQRYDAFGNTKGGPQRLNTMTGGNQGNAAIVTIAGGHQFAVWESVEPDNNGLGIYGRLIDAVQAPDQPTAANSAPVSSYTVQETRFAYDAAGHLRFAVDAAGYVTEHIYDALGQVLESRRYETKWTSSSLPLEESELRDAYTEATPQEMPRQATVYSYDDAGHVLSLTQSGDGLAATKEFVYDGLGQLVQEQDFGTAGTSGTPRLTTYLYDTAGRKRFIVDAMGFVTENVYDGFGNVIEKRKSPTSVTIPADISDSESCLDLLDDAMAAATASGYQFIRQVYDNLGRVRFTVDQQGHVSETLFNAYGQVKATIQYKNPITSLSTWTELAVSAAVIAANSSSASSPGQEALPAGIPTFELSSAGTAVNTFIDKQQQTPFAAALAGGGSVVVWVSKDQDSLSDNGGIYAQRYDATGAKVGSEFRINNTLAGNQTFFLGSQSHPTDVGRGSVAALPDGGFVVTWIQVNGGGAMPDSDVYVRRFNASGVAVDATDILVHSSSTNQEKSPTVAVLSNGEYFVAWHNVPTSGGGGGYVPGIVFQRFSASGIKIGSLVATGMSGDVPNLAVMQDDHLLVSVGNSARIYDPSQGLLGPMFSLGTVAGTDRIVSALSTGGFVSLWRNGQRVYGQFFDASGNKQGAEFCTSREDISGLLRFSVLTIDSGFILATAEYGGVTLRTFDLQGNQVNSAKRVVSASTDFEERLTLTRLSSDKLLLIRDSVEGAKDVISHLINMTFVSHTVQSAPVSSSEVHRTDYVYDANGRMRYLVGAAVEGVRLVTERVYDTFGRVRAEWQYPYAIPANTVMSESAIAAALTLAGAVEPEPEPPLAPIVPLPAGSTEFLVNYPDATGDQRRPSVVALTGGGSVVVWEVPSSDAAGIDIYAQVYNAAGAVVKAAYRVTSNSAGDQTFLSGVLGQGGNVAALPNGGFVVTWMSGTDIYIRRFNATGTAVDNGDRRVNTTTAGTQSHPSVTGLTGGGFVVAWQSTQAGGVGEDIYFQRFNANGGDEGVETRANTYLGVAAGNQDDQVRPVVTALSNGNFLISYVSEVDNNSLRGQIFNSTGVKVGAELQLNTTLPGTLDYATSLALASGAFVSVWRVAKADGTFQIYGQRFDSAGAKVGSEFLVNDTLLAANELPALASLSGGGFVVTFTAIGQDGSGSSVVGQRYDAQGNAIRGLLTMNSYTANSQGNSAITTLINGQQFVVWTSMGQDGDGSGIFGRFVNIGQATVAPPDPAAELVPGNTVARRMHYVLDELGRTIFTINTLNQVTFTEYDGFGRVKSTRVYDKKIDASVVTLAEAEGLSPSREDVEQALIDAGASARITSYTYDVLGRLTSTTDSLGYVELYTYDDYGNRDSLINKRGDTWSYRYDSLNRLVEEVSPEVAVHSITNGIPQTAQTARIVTRIDYTAFGQVESRTEGILKVGETLDLSQSRKTEYGYDDVGRQTTIIKPGFYNKVLGRFLATSDGTSNAGIPNNFKVSINVTYDAFGRAVRNSVRVDNDGGADDFVDSFKVYNDLDQVVYEIDAAGYLTEYSYDGFGNQTHVKRYATAVPTLALPAGEFLTEDDFGVGGIDLSDLADVDNDRTITTFYDELNRKTRVQQDVVHTYSYDYSTGVPIDAAPTTSFTYNGFGEVIKETREARTAAGGLISSIPQRSTYTYYDEGGRRKFTVDAGGYLSAYEYDDLNQLASQKEYATALRRWSINFEPVEPTDNAADRAVSYTYDAMGRLTKLTQENVSYYQLGSAGYEQNTDSLIASEFGYNELGQLAWQRDAARNLMQKEYDSLGRVIKVTEPERTTSIGSATSGTIGMGAVDPFLTAGSLAGFGARPLYGTVTASPTTTYALNAFGEVLVETHGAGNTDDTSATNDQAGGRRITRRVFDAAGNEIHTLAPTLAPNATLSTAGVQSYKVDSQGRRIEEMQVAQATFTHWTGQTGYTQTLRRTFGYDKLGHQTSTADWYTDPANSQNSLVTVQNATYNAFGEIISQNLNGNQNLTTVSYDRAGRSVLAAGPDGSTRTEYDVFGNATRITQQGDTLTSTDDRVTVNVYDALGRVKQQRLPWFDGSISTTPLTENTLEVVTPIVNVGYDRWGNVVSQSTGVFRQDGSSYDNETQARTTTYTYDHANRLVRTTQAQVTMWKEDGTSFVANPWHESRYDAAGNLVEEADGTSAAVGALRSRSKYYNQVGQLIKEVDATGITKHYAVDAFGNRVAMMIEPGIVSFTAFDAADRITSIGILRDEAGTKRYKSGHSPITEVTSGLWAVALQNKWYDTAGRLYAEVDTGWDREAGNITMHEETGGPIVEPEDIGNVRYTVHDERGNIIMTRNESNVTREYGYDINNRKTMERHRLEAVYDTGDLAVDGYRYLTWTYDNKGRLIQRTDLGNTSFVLAYNAFGQLATEYTPGSGGVMNNYKSYSYTANGLVSAIFEGDTQARVTGNTSSIENSTTSYRYNVLGERVREINSARDYNSVVGGVTTDVNTSAETRYKYDSLGRLLEAVAPAGQIIYTLQGTASATANLQSLKYSYDEFGNRRRIELNSVDQAGAIKDEEGWYLYDKEDRVTVSDGMLIGNHIAAYKVGSTAKGTSITYMWGRRTTEEQWAQSVAAAGGNAAYEKYRVQFYTYDEDELLTGINMNYRSRSTGSDSSATYTNFTSTSVDVLTHVYDREGNVIRTKTRSDTNTFKSESTYVYRGDGMLAEQTDYSNDAGTVKLVVKFIGGSAQAGFFIDLAGNQRKYTYTDFGGNFHHGTFTKSYAYFDTYKDSVVTAGVTLSGYTQGTTTYYYSGRGELQKIYVNGGSIYTYFFASNREGQMIGKKLQSSGQQTNFFYYRGNPIAQVGNLNGGAVEYDYVSTSLSEDTLARTPTYYTVKPGDTLGGIAMQIWGDANLWFLIAEENGLTSNSDLLVGGSLKIPNEVTSIYNDSNSFKPYNPNEIIGNVTPQAKAPPPPKKKCSAVAIIMVVVAVVATAMTGGAAGAAFVNLIGLGGAAAGTVAAVAATAISAAINGAVGAAIGSAASQLVGKALGAVDHFSWSAVGRAAVGGAITGGLLAGMEGLAGMNSTLASIMQNGNDFLSASINGVANYTGSYVTARLYGEKPSFSWSALASSVVAANVANSANNFFGVINPKDTNTIAFSKFDQVLRKLVAQPASAYINDKWTHADKPDYAVIAASTVADAFGNTLAGHVKELMVPKAVVMPVAPTAAPEILTIEDNTGTDISRAAATTDKVDPLWEPDEINLKPFDASNAFDMSSYRGPESPELGEKADSSDLSAADRGKSRSDLSGLTVIDDAELSAIDGQGDRSAIKNGFGYADEKGFHFGDSYSPEDAHKVRATSPTTATEINSSDHQNWVSEKKKGEAEFERVKAKATGKGEAVLFNPESQAAQNAVGIRKKPDASMEGSSTGPVSETEEYLGERHKSAMVYEKFGDGVSVFGNGVEIVADPLNKVPGGRVANAMSDGKKAARAADAVDDASDVAKADGKILRMADDSGVERVPGVILLKEKQGTLKGHPELPHANASADMVRSLQRQNESAEILANRGLDVTHLPNTGKKGGNPDLDIGGRSADVYSPRSKNPNTIWDNMAHKVEHQAPDIVLNLSDSPLSTVDMLRFLQNKPVEGLQNLYLIKGNEVILKRY